MRHSRIGSVHVQHRLFVEQSGVYTAVTLWWWVRGGMSGKIAQEYSVNKQLHAWAGCVH